MTKICCFLLCVYVTAIISPLNAFAQKQTFDISTYTVPKGWVKQPSEAAIQFSKEDAAKGTYCMITLYNAVPGTANSKENFDLAWASLVKEMVTVSTAPEMQPVATENGWEAQSGYAPFESEGTKGVVMLVTSSSSSKMVNIIILTNTNEYEKEMTAFLESVSLKKSETTIQQIQTPAANNNNTAVIGTWGISVVVPYRSATEGTAGSNVRQYTFNANGTYSFYIKTFKYNFDKLLLTKETGTYQISGNKITISPQKSVIESWSKKDGTDNWGKLVSTQNKTLEKTTYQFTKHYSVGMQEWNLVLQANNETPRDGPYNGGTVFRNAWLYSIPCSKCLIELPSGQQTTTEEIIKESVQQTATNNNAPILGTWGKTGSVNPAYNDAYATSIAGYSTDQYTFNSNGTYHFVSKTFGMSFAKLLLVKENGAYQISGNTVTVNPQKSVIEAWSKKDGVDKWGKLLSTQTRKIEKVTYTFTKHYFSGIQLWNLVLQADKQTQRDGPFSSNTTFNNAWYYSPISANNTAIELPK